MSAGLVRTGGIMVFVLLVVGIILSVVIGATSMKVGADGKMVVQGGGVMQIVTNIIYVAIIAFVYWTTKGLFNALGFRRADVPILILLVVLALNLVLGFLGGAGLGSIGSASALQGAVGFIGIVSLIVLLVFFIAWLWFSIACLGFGKAIGSGLWKAIGIVYLIGTGLFVLFMVLMILAVVAKSPGLLVAGGVLALIGMLVLLAGWICHGIGLITGANRIGAAPAA